MMHINFALYNMLFAIVIIISIITSIMVKHNEVVKIYSGMFDLSDVYYKIPSAVWKLPKPV